MTAFNQTLLVIAWIALIACLMTLGCSSQAPAPAEIGKVVKVYNLQGKFLFRGERVGFCTNNGILFRAVEGPIFGKQLKKTRLCAPESAIILLDLNDPNVYSEKDLNGLK